jgi:hypothetical protein
MRVGERRTGDNSGERDRGPGTGISLTAFAALLAAVASTAGIAYQIWPDHHFRATMRVGSLVERNISYDSYLRGRLKLDDGERRSNRHGMIFLVRAQVEGFDRSHLSLFSYLYTADSDKRASTSKQSSQLIFRPGTPINVQIGQAWVPLPKSSGTYYVRFELYAGKALIADANSSPFKISLRRLPPGFQ